jgi:hypothetical protein
VFTDPQSVTISGAAKTLNRTSSTENGGKFATADRLHRFLVSHSYGKRVRHTIRLEQDSVIASPLLTGVNVVNSDTVYLVVDHAVGRSTTDVKAAVDGFIANLSASSGANITKLIGGES